MFLKESRHEQVLLRPRLRIDQPLSLLPHSTAKVQAQILGWRGRLHLVTVGATESHDKGYEYGEW